MPKKIDYRATNSMKSNTLKHKFEYSWNILSELSTNIWNSFMCAFSVFYVAWINVSKLAVAFQKCSEYFE